jgi:hypothetical protein
LANYGCDGFVGNFEDESHPVGHSYERNSDSEPLLRWQIEECWLHFHPVMAIVETIGG